MPEPIQAAAAEATLVPANDRIVPSNRVGPSKGPSEPASKPLAVPAKAPQVHVQVTLVAGAITNLEVPVAVVARYDGFPLAGGARAYDRKLDSWLTRALELGMIGSGLGQLFPFNLEKRHKAGQVKTDFLLLASMGEPGRFAQDGLRYLVSNIVVATKGLGQDVVAMSLFGTRRNELSITDAIRALMRGVIDGYERFHAIATTVTDNQQQFVEAVRRPLGIMLVFDNGSAKLSAAEQALKQFVAEHPFDELTLEVLPPQEVEADSGSPPTQSDTDAEVSVTLVRVTKAKAEGFGTIAADGSAGKPTPRELSGVNETIEAELLEFSGLSDVAAVSVRRVEVNKYWLEHVPPRMIKARDREEQERLSTFFSNCLFPEDFRKHVETAKNLIFEVDDFTAPFPWEMAAHQAFSRTTFIGTNIGVSRQFRSLLSPPPTAVPPLNTTLKVLVIADPASGSLSLAKAREEGGAIVRIFEEAAKAWVGLYNFEVTVRIGSKAEGDTNSTLKALGDLRCVKSKPRTCDPLDLAMLIVNEHFDVIHYAGHGFCDSSRQAGWVFAPDCLLTAKEIFRVRQVPRLVFANACFSAVTSGPSDAEVEGHRKKSVGLAEAFFARGIPNYVGAGWPVGDAAAKDLARWFYARVLGLNGLEASGGVQETAPPATIGEALRNAREQVFGMDPNLSGQGIAQLDPSTWGAYQHYGRVEHKLLPFMNLPEDQRTD